MAKKLPRNTPSSIKRNADDVNECLIPNICGKEAGCLNTPGSYVCYCPGDLKPVNPDGTCTRGKRFKNKMEKKTDLLESPFTSQKLHEIVHPSSNPTEDAVNNMSRPYRISNAGQYGDDGNSPTVLSVVLPLTITTFVLIVVMVIVFLLRRRQNVTGWFCIDKSFDKNTDSTNKSGGTRVNVDDKNVAARHATNPNYYTNGTDDQSSFIKQMNIVEISRSRIAFISEIGEGCFGKVYKGSYMKDCPDVGILVAIKILKDAMSCDAAADFEREVDILSSFDHQNIVKLLGVVTQGTGQMPWMVFEYMRYGDLTEFLRRGQWTDGNKSNNLTKSDMMYIARQVCKGMVYLSKQHFVHRDLATRNCLVGDGLSVKISDFGMSRDIYTCDYYKIGGSRMLPVRWMAPESVMYGKFTLQSDAWSFGVVLWEIYSHGKQPYYGHSNEEVVKLILQGILLSPSDSCPPTICNVMAGCWKTEPSNRLSFFDVDKLLNRQTIKVPKLFEIENYLVPDVHQPLTV
ncbi:Uncharacterised protein g1801 [Pycnogonum litorale]